MFIAKQNEELKWGLHNFYATDITNGPLILCLNIDSYKNIISYIIKNYRIKNADISESAGQHLVQCFILPKQGSP